MNRPRSNWWPDEPSETAREIHVEERDGFMGLYNHLGEPLYRRPERFGFDPDRWKQTMKKCGKKKGRGG